MTRSNRILLITLTAIAVAVAFATAYARSAGEWWLCVLLGIPFAWLGIGYLALRVSQVVAWRPGMPEPVVAHQPVDEGGFTSSFTFKNFAEDNQRALSSLRDD